MYEKSRFKALEIFLTCEKNVKKIKKNFPKRFDKDITEDQKSILLNAMSYSISEIQLLVCLEMILSGLQVFRSLKQKPEFKESVAEITKIRRQKISDDKHTTDMPELESEESSAQGKEQKAKGLKVLTSSQMFRKSPISLAELDAGNISVKP